MADPVGKKKTGTTLDGLVPAPVNAMLTKIFRKGALAVIATGIVSIAVAAFAQNRGIHAIDEATDRKVEPINKKLSSQQTQIDEVRVDVKELSAQMRRNEERAAERFDVLYRTMLTGKPSYRAAELAEPAAQQDIKDGGK